MQLKARGNMDKKLVDQIVQGIAGFFSKNAPAAVPQAVPAAPAQAVTPPVTQAVEIDWSNPKSKISANFTVEEALMLPSWGVMHVPSEDEKKAIVGIAQKVSQAALILEKAIGRKVSINVHAFMRPGKANIPGSKWDGQDYNRYIYETQVWKDLTPEQKALKKVPNSPHRTGHAIDFHIVGFESKEKCLQIRTMLLTHLEALGLRMEKMDNGGWVHLDDLPVVNSRYFNP
jgi:hypothetical protein